MSDFDNIVIGLKSTNQMNFEDLIEEKLKIADQLDFEQLELTKRSVSNKKKNIRATINTQVVQDDDEFNDQDLQEEIEIEIDSDLDDQEEHNESNELIEITKVKPRPFLKRGEGLKRYQPKRNNKKDNTSSLKKNSLNANTNPNRKSVSTSNIGKSSVQNTTNKSNKTTSNISNNNNRLSLKNNKTIDAVSTQRNSKNIKPTPLNSVKKNTKKDEGNKDIPDIHKDIPDKETFCPKEKATRILKTNRVNNEIDFRDDNLTEMDRRKEDEINKNANDYDQNDNELDEFEKLEHYVEEHPSFVSSVSYVETFLTNKKSNIDSKSNYARFKQTETEMRSHENFFNRNQTEIVNSNPSSKIAEILQELNLNEKITIENIYKSYRDFEKNNDNYEGDFNINKNDFELEENYSFDPNLESELDRSNEIKNENANISGSTGSRSVLTRKIKRICSKKVSDKDSDDDFETKDLNNEQDQTENYNQHGFEFMTNSSYKSSNYKDTENNNDYYYEQSCVNEQLRSVFESKENDEDNQTSQNTLKLSLEDISDEQMYEKKLDHGKKVQFNDTESWMDHSTRSNTNDAVIHSNDSNQRENDPLVVSKLINKLFPSVKEYEKSLKSIKKQNDEQLDKERLAKINQDQSSENSNQINISNKTSDINATLLKEKINQLETEIEKFQRKNFELDKIKEKLNTEIKLAEANRKLFDKQKQEELNRLKELHEQDVKNFKQEKKIFEQYKQSIKDKPDRKERDEIERLNKQVLELSEELKSRETRWIANNNRLKERIETLEKEKLEFKKELKMVEQQRIESLIKMTSSGTSMPNSLINSANTNTNLPILTSQNQAQPYNNKNNPLTLKINSFNTEFENIQPKSNLNLNNNPNIMQLKRTTSEKSLLNSSPSSSSSSIDSAGSLAHNSSLSNNFNMLNNNQQFKSSNLITSSHALNSFDSFKSDSRGQSSKQISPNQTNVHKTVKFNLDQLNEIRNYSPQRTDTIKNDNFECEQSYMKNKSNDVKLNKDEYVISSLTGTDRRVKVKDVRVVEGKQIEKLLEDDTLLTVFQNGTIKEVSSDKKNILVKFFNGDRKEMNRDTGTETYFYAETNITQIIYSNGLEILKFPNGQIEKHHVDKTREIIFPDKICKFIYPDGNEETRLPNGTCIKINKNGDKIIDYPNKQREIHTKEYKQREYPDGSVKTVYTNGLSETKYANGRIRLKDSLGNIISDKKA